MIGAGPGGIFAAYELMQHSPQLKVAVFAHLTDELYESKIVYRTEKYSDKVRTFCMNPRALWSTRTPTASSPSTDTATRTGPGRRRTPTSPCWWPSMIGTCGFSQRNITIAALSLRIGLGFTQVPEMFAIFPNIIRTIFAENCIAVVFFAAIIMNLIMPKDREA